MENYLSLPDGRQLCYVEYGDPEGSPIILVHGNPNSRLLYGVLPGSPFLPYAVPGRSRSVWIAIFIKGAGHFGIFEHMPEMLQALFNDRRGLLGSPPKDVDRH